MGEVYRARDTRLDRTVAIKVLPEEFSKDPDLKQRFEREARAISQLNHPNICTLHDVGSDSGTDYLVMEYLEGESLADRLRKGALPLDQLLKIGKEIAGALDKAHRAGIVHRDLKPGNIMLTKAGAKLLDFGLAKPTAMGAISAGASTPLLSAAMTMTSPSPHVSPLTSAGMLIGTLQYMSPEQLQGIEADARSDIFALGAVLYEMAAGKRAFEGKSQIKVASAILEDRPEPLRSIHPATPPALEHMIYACLEKNPDDRLQSAHDVSVQLKWVEQASSDSPATPAPTARSKRRAWLSWAALSAMAVVAAAFAFAYLGQAKQPVSSVRATILPPEKAEIDLVGDNAGPPVISPDGTKIAFVAHVPSSPQTLWVRSLNSPAAIRLDGTEEAFFPFWSPDGKYVAFFARGNMSKVPAGGGPVTNIAPISQPRGGTWGADDTILFAADYQAGISRVSANGGSVTSVTKLDPAFHTTHRWPWLLPDGKHFLYFATSHMGGNRDHEGIYLGTLGSGESRLLVPADSAGQYASGFLLYWSNGTLVAQRFNPSSGTLSSPPLAVVDHVMNDGSIWRPIFSASENGFLVYEPGTTTGVHTQLAWYDRTGNMMTQLAGGEFYQEPHLSPDGSRVAVSAGASQRQIWIIDIARGSKSRLSFDATNDISPSWSPDGKMVAYTTSEGAVGARVSTIKARPTNGSGPEQVLAQGDASSNSPQYAQWSPDGRFLTYINTLGSDGHDIWVKPLMGEGKPSLLVQPASPRARISSFRISPDSHWIAYTSNESGEPQVYVIPFPSGDGKWQVSTTPSEFTAWRGDSKELYTLGMDESIYAADVSGNGKEFVIHGIKPLFSKVKSFSGSAFAPTGMPFDVTPDGKRFIINTTTEGATSPLSLVVNWPAELKK
jgi:serine/threonine protein kinase